MNLLRLQCMTVMAAITASLLSPIAIGGIFTVPVLVPIEVDVTTNPVAAVPPAVTGNFTYSVTCTDSQGGASVFTFPAPTALTLTANALTTPFSPRLTGNAVALQQSGSFQITDPKDCLVTQLTRPSPPTGYVWNAAAIGPLTVTNFSNNETRIAPDSVASFINVLNVATYSVTGTASPPGSGTVVCVSPVTHGSTSTCSATAATGFTFAGIASSCGAPSSSASYTTGPVTANCTVTATFTQNTFTVTGIASPLAGGVVTCTSPVNQGSTSACTASANTGFTFTGITSTCGPASSNASYVTGPVTSNCTVTATFVQNTFTVTGVATPTAGGVVSCVSPVNQGSTSLCTASANMGYSFTGITSTCGAASTSSSYTTGPVNANCIVTATFTLNTFVVTGVASPTAAGSVTCASPVNFNTTSTCTATANTGYALAGISGCGGAASTASPYTTGAVTANCTVTATFSLNSYLITALASPAAGGTVSCTPNPANFGTTSTCTATANTGYALSGISGCNGTAATTTPYTTGAISAACTVTATFQPLTFPVSTLVVVSGSGSLTCAPNPVPFGTAATCTAVTNAGYLLTGISGCGGQATTSGTFVTGPITAACTVTALFTVPVAPAIAVPALEQWSLLLLMLAICLPAGVALLRRVS